MEKTRENFSKLFSSWFDDLKEYDKIVAYNAFCEEVEWMDDIIHFNDDDFFNLYYREDNLMDFANLVKNSEWDYHDDYVWTNCCGFLISGNFEDTQMDLDEMENYIWEHEDFIDTLSVDVSELKEFFK